MQAIILHRPGVRIGDLKRRLEAQHVGARSIPVAGHEPPEEILGEAHIIIVYCHQPGDDLLKIIPEIRRKRSLVPVVVIEENKNPETQKSAHFMGADGYFSLPISFSNLVVAFKKMITKKAILLNARRLRAFNMLLDINKRFLKRNSKVIPLRNKEYALLEFFILNKGKLLTRTMILENVWDRNAHFSSNTVDVHINRLRRKVDYPFREKFIHTIPCIGYVFDKKKLFRAA